MRRRRMLYRRTLYPLLLACPAILWIVGCGDGKIRRYPVSGSVSVDGKAAEGAIVVFCPVDGTEQFKRERPMGVADASGKFELTTFIAKDGAPPGDYKVLVRWPAPKKAPAPNEDPDRISGGFDRLKGRYLNPDQSGLTAKVADAPTEVPAFDLKSK